MWGAAQAAINEANGLKKISKNLVEEKEELVYRCYIALGQFHIIINEVKATASAGKYDILAYDVRRTRVPLKQGANMTLVYCLLNENKCDCI